MNGRIKMTFIFIYVFYKRQSDKSSQGFFNQEKDSRSNSMFAIF